MNREEDDMFSLLVEEETPLVTDSDVTNQIRYDWDGILITEQFVMNQELTAEENMIELNTNCALKLMGYGIHENI